MNVGRLWVVYKGAKPSPSYVMEGYLEAAGQPL